jgi:pyruvate/2-oxoglutarate dehydrogenase complex dihydrolipoamide acyltransferase (E2) component
VNGARITRAVVNEGDRILVGGCLMRVVARDQAAPLEAPAPTASPRSATAMQGRLEEVPLPDLLQLFATSRKSGVLAIQAQGHAAEISLERGRVTSCVIDGRTEHGAEKSFYRLLSWTGGHFELRPAAAPPSTEGTATLGASLEALLMEGMRQIDELKRLRTIIPPRLVPAGPPPPDLEEEDRALLALAMRLGQRDAVLDASPLPDLPAAERLARLLQRGFLRGA